jgi:hypothetical protein
MSVQAEYIAGVVEFTGTVSGPNIFFARTEYLRLDITEAMKTDLTSSTGPLGGGIPPNMRREVSGVAQTITFGWEHNAGVNNAILLPSTFVAIASILIVLVTLCAKWIRSVSVEHVDFDPNEPLLLMAAASAGGMRDTFHGLTKKDLEEGGEKKVMLGQIGYRDGLVQVT